MQNYPWLLPLQSYDADNGRPSTHVVIIFPLLEIPERLVHWSCLYLLIGISRMGHNDPRWSWHCGAPISSFLFLRWSRWSYISGWWLSHPSEKYESQLGWLFPTEWKNKKCSKPPFRYTLWKSRCPDPDAACVLLSPNSRHYTWSSRVTVLRQK